MLQTRKPKQNKNPIEEQNRRAWDDRVRQAKWYVDTATDEDFQQPLKVADPFGWAGDVVHKEVLCLAAGGGRHGVLLAAAGARVTVVDLSPEMLELDRQVARKRRLTIATILASMDDLSEIPDGTFDLVLQPVSSCYVPDLLKVYGEVARVTRQSGIYISHHKQPVNLQAGGGWDPQRKGYLVTESYYRKGPLPPAPEEQWHREAGTIEFLHTWEELLGGLCRHGFAVTDLIEPCHADPQAGPGSFRHRSCYLPPYVAIKARREPASSKKMNDVL